MWLVWCLSSWTPGQALPEPGAADGSRIEALRAAEDLVSEGNLDAAIERLEALADVAAEGRSGSDSSGGAPSDEELRTHIQLLSNLAWTLHLAGRSEEAQARSHRALILAQEGGEALLDARVLVKRNLAAIAGGLGALDEAQVWIEDAWRETETLFGKTPITAEVRREAAQLALRRGDLDLALDHLEHALAISERLLGGLDTSVAETLGELAQVLAAQGKLDPAVLLTVHGRRIFEAAGRAGTEGWQGAVEAELQLAYDLGERARALELLATIQPSNLDPLIDDPRRREAELWTAGWQLRFGDASGAAERLGRVAVAVDRGESSDPFEQLRVLLPLARSLRLEGKPGMALRVVERGLGAFDRLIESGGTPDPGIQVELWVEGGLARLESGQFEGAIVELHRALDARRERYGQAHPALVPILEGLLRAQFQAHGVTPALRDLLDMVRGPLASGGPSEAQRREQTARWTRDRGAEGAILRIAFEVAAFDGQRGQQVPSEEAPDPGAAFRAALAALTQSRARARTAVLAPWTEGVDGLGCPELLECLGLRDRLLRAPMNREQRASFDRDFAESLGALRDRAPRLANELAPRNLEVGALAERLRSEGRTLLAVAETDRDLWTLELGPTDARGRVRRVGSLATLDRVLSGSEDEASTSEESRRIRDLLARIGGRGEAPILLAVDGALALEVPGEGTYRDAEGRVQWTADLAGFVERDEAEDDVQALVSEGSGGAVLRGPLPHAPRPGVHRVADLRARFPRLAIGIEADSELPGSDILAGEELRESALAECFRAEGVDPFEAISGALSGVTLQLPLVIDGEVPAATCFLVSPELADDTQPAWRQADGVLDLHECRELAVGLGSIRVVLGEGMQCDSNRVAGRSRPRSSALDALVYALTPWGGGRVTLEGEGVVREFR